MKNLAILGASGHGKVVADIAEQSGWLSIKFFDDIWPTKTQISNWRVVGNTEILLESLVNYDGVVVAIGDNGIRKEKLDLLKRSCAELVKLIHPSAIISQYSKIGLGTVIMPGVVVNADTDIGMGVILNTGCTIDHDCRLGDAVHISPGVHLAGNVHVGSLSWIGVAASTCQNIRIGSNVVVGAGAVVISDLPEGVTAIGLPAHY